MTWQLREDELKRALRQESRVREDALKEEYNQKLRLLEERLQRLEEYSAIQVVDDFRKGVEHPAFKVGIVRRLKHRDCRIDVIGITRSPNIAYAPHPFEAIGTNKRRIERHQGRIQNKCALARAGRLIAIHVLGGKAVSVCRSRVPAFGRIEGNQSTVLGVSDSRQDFDTIDREHDGFLVENTLTGILNLKAQALL